MWPVSCAYYINLESDEAKRTHMETLGQRLNLPLKRFEALRGEGMGSSPSFMRGNRLTAGERGCMMSHLGVWTRALQDGHSSVMILEDDVDTYVGGPELQTMLNKIYHILPDFDIVYLGACMDACEKMEHLYENVYRTHRPICTHAYILSAKGITKMLQRLPFSRPIDQEVAHAIKAGDLVAYRFFPSLFYQNVFAHPSSLRKFSKSMYNVTECAPPPLIQRPMVWCLLGALLLSLGALAAIVIIRRRR